MNEQLLEVGVQALRGGNKHKETSHHLDEAERAKLAFQDLTDKENPYFMYVM